MPMEWPGTITKCQQYIIVEHFTQPSSVYTINVTHTPYRESNKKIITDVYTSLMTPHRKLLLGL